MTKKNTIELIGPIKSMEKCIKDYIDCFSVNEPDLLANIGDTFNDLNSLDLEIGELNNSLQVLTHWLESKEKQKCLEGMAAARLRVMNIENAFSNLADIMSDLIVNVRDK